MSQNMAFDKIKAELFATKLLEILNGGCLALMISIGHKTGLFDVLSRLHTLAPQKKYQKRLT